MVSRVRDLATGPALPVLNQRLSVRETGINHTNDLKVVEAYLALLPEADRKALERIRGVVLKLAPAATQRVSYGVVVFAQGGDLLAIGAATNHMSLYTMSPQLVERLKGDLERWDVRGSTVQFKPGLQLPMGVIEKIVRARLKANKV